MKLCKLLNRPIEFVSPCQCRGPEMMAVAAASSAMQLIATGETNKANQQLNAKQFKFAAQEAEKQRRWQSDEWTRQYNLQRDEWYNQLKAQAETQWQQYLRQSQYQSPVNQVGRLAQAGLNPSAVLGGQGSSGLVSAASGNLANVGSPSVPTGGSVSGASASVPSQIPFQMPQLFQSMGQTLRDLAAASKDNELTRPMVAYLGSQLIGQNLRNEWQLFQNDILSRTKDAKVQQAFQDLENAFADYALKSAMYENYSADSLLKSCEAALTMAKKRCTDEEYKEIQFRVTHMFETWSVEQELKKSQTVENYASANYSTVLAKTEDDIRQFKVDNLKLLNTFQETINKIKDNDWKVSDATLKQQIETVSTQLAEQCKREGLLTEQAQVVLDKSIKENNWWLTEHIIMPIFKQWNENMNRSMDRVAGAASFFVK